MKILSSFAHPQVVYTFKATFHSCIQPDLIMHTLTHLSPKYTIVIAV